MFSLRMLDVTMFLDLFSLYWIDYKMHLYLFKWVDEWIPTLNLWKVSHGSLCGSILLTIVFYQNWKMKSRGYWVDILEINMKHLCCRMIPYHLSWLMHCQRYLIPLTRIKMVHYEQKNLENSSWRQMDLDHPHNSLGKWVNALAVMDEDGLQRLVSWLVDTRIVLLDHKGINALLVGFLFGTNSRWSFRNSQWSCSSRLWSTFLEEAHGRIESIRVM